MKTCYNCNSLNKDQDIYCRNLYYTWIKVGTIIGIIGIIIMVILFAIMYL